MAYRSGTAVVIGAGPAGLTAAYELLERTRIRPIVVEGSGEIGGLARTIVHAGNRMDLGGHRFFSKSDRVMRWWLSFLPIEAAAPDRFVLAYQGQARDLEGLPSGPDPEREDRVMLVRSRRSRILFGRKVYDYPLQLSLDTLSKLGLARVLRIGATYGHRVLRPRRPEVTLEDFFINRFGDELYRTFFRAYTEKVWGRSCAEITAEWGAQRVKGLSIARALRALASTSGARQDAVISLRKGKRPPSSSASFTRSSGPAHCGRPSPARSWLARARSTCTPAWSASRPRASG